MEKYLEWWSGFEEKRSERKEITFGNFFTFILFCASWRDRHCSQKNLFCLESISVSENFFKHLECDVGGVEVRNIWGDKREVEGKIKQQEGKKREKKNLDNETFGSISTERSKKGSSLVVIASQHIHLVSFTRNPI